MKYAQMFLHYFVCSVHFPTVQKHTGFETIPHLYWENDKRVKPANGFQPAFSGHSVKGGRQGGMEGKGGKEHRILHHYVYNANKRAVRVFEGVEEGEVTTVPSEDKIQ